MAVSSRTLERQARRLPPARKNRSAFPSKGIGDTDDMLIARNPTIAEAR